MLFASKEHVQGLELRIAELEKRYKDLASEVHYIKVEDRALRTFFSFPVAHPGTSERTEVKPRKDEPLGDSAPENWGVNTTLGK